MAPRKFTPAPEPVAAPQLRILTLDELDEILDRDDLGTELVPMPEWGPGVAVRIRGLSMNDIYDARRAGRDIEDPVERQATIDTEFIRMAVVEPRLSVERARRFREKSSDAVLRLLSRIATLNGSSREVADKLTGEFPAERES